MSNDENEWWKIMENNDKKWVWICVGIYYGFVYFLLPTPLIPLVLREGEITLCPLAREGTNIMPIYKGG